MSTDPGREIPLVVGDQTYTLYAGNRALRLVERESGVGMIDLMSQLENISMETLTILVWAFLQRNHPNVMLNPSQEDTESGAVSIDDLIDDAGYEVVMTAVTKAADKAFPSSGTNGATEESGKGRSGPGRRSSSSRSRRA